MVDNLSKHLSEPAISPAQYSRSFRYRLGEGVLKKTRIYLDQKYWVYCRDAREGIPQRPIHSEIWQLLRDNVRSNKIVCPIGYPVFHETFKQANAKRRMQLAQTIDELSCGIAVQPFIELRRIELLHALMSLSGKGTHPLKQIVWLPVGWVCGEMVSQIPNLDPGLERAIQKAMFDEMANISFATMIDMLKENEPPKSDADFQARQTEEAKKFRHEFKTFKQAFMTEVAGYLDVTTREIEGAIQYLCKQVGAAVPSGTALQESTRLFRNLIYNAYDLEKLTTEIPSLHIGSGLHAVIRLQNRSYEKGDTDDRFHACSAVPCCDMFFTEKKLAGLLTSKQLEFDKKYKCEVFWRDEEILDRLKRL